MFTKQDYENYFGQVVQKEEEMVQFINQILHHLEDENMIAVFKFLLEEEQRHAKLAENLKSYLD